MTPVDKLKVRDRSECDDAIAEVGRLRRELLRLDTVMGDKLAAAKTEFARAAQPLKARCRAVEEQIERYCDADRRNMLVDGKTKTVRFNNGEVAWRAKPPKVNIRNVEKAIAWVIEAGAKFRRFLRVSHDLDKEAMLKEPELAGEIPGVKVKSDGETFEIKPFETKLAEEA